MLCMAVQSWCSPLQHSLSMCHTCLQESSHSESMSTLAFGGRVSEIALGAAKKNVESGAVFEAREAARGAEGAINSERRARKDAEGRASAAEAALASAHTDVDRLQVDTACMHCGQALPVLRRLHDDCAYVAD